MKIKTKIIFQRIWELVLFIVVNGNDQSKLYEIVRDLFLVFVLSENQIYNNEIYVLFMHKVSF
jgi:hypothetical protein